MTQSAMPSMPGTNASAPMVVKTNTLAIIALIAAFVFAPAGLICGFIARGQIKVTREQGDGLALAAILISALVIVIWFVAGFAMFALFSHVADHCFIPAPATAPQPGMHWVCSGNNTWISQG